MSATCGECGRTLAEGESAWADDWTVLETIGTEARWRRKTRYTCDDCAGIS